MLQRTKLRKQPTQGVQWPSAAHTTILESKTLAQENAQTMLISCIYAPDANKVHSAATYFGPYNNAQQIHHLGLTDLFSNTGNTSDEFGEKGTHLCVHKLAEKSKT
jgi:hypothetical protein